MFTDRILCPEVLAKNTSNKLFGEKKKSPMVIFVTTLVNAFVCYFYHMIYGLGCPDTLSEGVYYYRTADYATSQARWMIRYINEIFGKNVVITSLIVLIYCLMIGISVYIICRITDITAPWSQILICTMMVSFPVVLHHFAYFYMALAYSFSFLMVTVGTALIRTRKIPWIICGILCYLMMLGSYQAYIGAISALAVVLFIHDILNGKELKKGVFNFLLSAAGGIAACFLNFPVSNFMMKIHHLSETDRVSAFSFKSIVDNIGFSLKYSYVWFFSYFDDEVLSRNRLYLVFFVILGVLSVLTVIKCIKNKQIIKAILFVILMLIMPLAMNLLLIVIPENGMRDLLRYQYALLYPLMFILFKFLDDSFIAKLAKYPAYLVMILSFVANVISANSTEIMYKLSYDYCEQQFLQAMERVYDLEDYKENETKIILGGLPSMEVVIENNPKIFRYAESEGGPVFWGNVFGMVSSREHFFPDFLGVRSGFISSGEYFEVVNSPEYADMSVWPAEGCVQMIGDYAVIKYEEEPPKY